MRAGALLLLLALVAPCVAAEQAAPTAKGRAVSVVADPVDIGSDGLADGVRLLGAWSLTSPDPDFGGLSGLLIEGDRLTAVTDFGQWLTARLTGDRAAPLADARMAPLLLSDGTPIGEGGTDAEALARLPDGRLAVAFERDHRVLVHLGSGRTTLFAQSRAFEALPFNGGLESLARLPDGRLIALGEARGDGGFPVFLLDGATVTEAPALPPRSKHEVTGADIGPDGALYMVQRHYAPLTGVSIRVLRYGLGPDGRPEPDSADELAAFGMSSGIDNMEAIAAVPGPEGGLDLWLLSDDNFNPAQRTLLVRLGAGR